MALAPSTRSERAAGASTQRRTQTMAPSTRSQRTGPSAPSRGSAPSSPKATAAPTGRDKSPDPKVASDQDFGEFMRSGRVPPGADLGAYQRLRRDWISGNSDRIGKTSAALTPLRVVFDYTGKPAAIVGNLIAGRPKEAAKAALNIAVPPTMASDRLGSSDTYPGDALREQGLLPGGKLGAVLGFAGNVGLDPLTAVSLGGAGAARQVGASASRLSVAAAKAGGRSSLQEVARRAAMTAAERAAVPRTLSVNARIPFTRGKEVPLVESTRVPAAASKLAQKVVPERMRDPLRQAVMPNRGADPRVGEVYQATRRAAEAERAAISQKAKALDKAIMKREKELGLPRGAGGEAIARHLDSPEAYPAPKGFEDLATQSRSALDEFNATEKAAGVEYTEVDTYVPHLLADPKSARRFNEAYRRPGAGTVDNPFFVKKRTAPDLDTFEKMAREAGATPEFNVARLIESRGHASVRARTKKAFDDAVAGQYGVAKGAKPRQIASVPGLPAAAGKDAGAATRATGPAWKEAKRSFDEYPASKYHAGTRLPPDIAESVRRVHKEIQGVMKDEDAIAGVTRFVHSTTGRWKALALLSPGYHVRNAQDDLMRAYWAGARNPASFVQAGAALAGKGKAIAIRKGPHKGSLTPDELIRLAESEGVIRTGWIPQETISSAAVGKRGAKGPGRGPVARASRKVGEAREDMTRLGTFLERLRAGDNAAEAARKTREYLIDYGEVGQLVQHARRSFAPFITYPSKAIPIVLREAAKRPGRVAHLGMAMDTGNELAGNPDLSELPPWAASSRGVPVPDALRSAIGAPKDQALLFNPEGLIAPGSLNMLDPRQIRMNTLGRLASPAIRVPIELAAGKSMFTGTPWSKKGAFAPRPAQEVAGLFGIDLPARKDAFTGEVKPAYPAALDAILRAWPQYGQASMLTPGGPQSERLAWAKFLAGLPISPYDRARAAYYAQKFGDR